MLVWSNITIFHVIFSLKLPAFSIPIRNMHPLSSISIATCLAFLLNDALVHAATNPSTITGAPVNPSTITGTGFTLSTATDTANGHQIGDEILGINDPSKSYFQFVPICSRSTCFNYGKNENDGKVLAISRRRI